jgi:hypothetical protein
MLTSLRSLIDAALGKVPGKPDRLDTATRMAQDADFTGRGEPAIPHRESQRKRTRTRKPQREIDTLDELERILGEEK